MIALLTAAIGPALAILCYLYLRDRYNGIRFTDVFKSFIIGALLVFPIMVLQHAFVTEGFFKGDLTRAFILYGFFEEFFKWFLLFSVTYKHIEFSRPYDGIVYGVALSLGFATVENFLYLLAYGVHTAIFRALLPVSSHALFGIIMGYYLGRAKFETKQNVKYILVLSLLLPVALHGMYDFIIMSADKYILFVLLPFMFFLWWLGLQKVKLTQ